jgi:hypothetical protein
MRLSGNYRLGYEPVTSSRPTEGPSAATAADAEWAVERNRGK